MSFGVAALWRALACTLRQLRAWVHALHLLRSHRDDGSSMAGGGIGGVSGGVSGVSGGGGGGGASGGVGDGAAPDTAFFAGVELGVVPAEVMAATFPGTTAVIAGILALRVVRWLRATATFAAAQQVARGV